MDSSSATASSVSQPSPRRRGDSYRADLRCRTPGLATRDRMMPRHRVQSRHTSLDTPCVESVETRAADRIPSTVSGIVAELADIAREALTELEAMNDLRPPPSGDTTVVNAVVPA